MKPQPPVIVQDFSKGIHTNYDDGLLPPNILRYAINCYIDSAHTKIGHLKSRIGIEAFFGSIDDDIAAIDADDEIVGMFALEENKFITAVQTNGGSAYTYYYNIPTGTFEDIGASPLAWAGGEILFENFDGYVYAIEPSSTKFYAWDSNSLANNWTNLIPGVWTNGTTPVALKEFQGKLYVASGSNRLYYSAIANLSGSITTFNILDRIILPTTGNLSALEKVVNQLIIFTTNEFFIWDGVSIQSSPLYKYGSVNQAVVKTIQNSTFFVYKGIDYYSVFVYKGGEPIDISSPVQEFLKKSNLIQDEKISSEFGAWDDGKNYFLSIGDVTINNKVIPNIVLCYSLESNAWTVMSITKNSSTYNNFFKYSIKLVATNSGANTIFHNLTFPSLKSYTVIGGTPLGTRGTGTTSIAPVVWSYETNGIDDVGESESNPIEILIQTHELDFGSKSRFKQLNKFDVFADGNYGIANVSYRIDGRKWKDLGGLTGKQTTFEPGIQFKKLELRITGENTGEQFILEGFEFFDWAIEDYET